MKSSFHVLPAVAIVLGLAACSENTHPETQQDLAVQQTNERTDERADQKVDRIDMNAEQRKDAVETTADQQKDQIDANADTTKDQIDKQADRSKFDAELKARLDKVDVRIADVTTKLPKAKPASKGRANDMLKSAKEQRATLGDSYSKLSTVPEANWEPTKKQIETSIKTLEGDVDKIEELIAT